MKSLIPLTFLILTLSACGQSPKRDRSVNQTKDTTTIFKNISADLCNCTYSTMRNNKPSTSIDSCYTAIQLIYTDSLKLLGFDPATQVGQNKLSNEVILKLNRNCPDLSNLFQNETDEENAKKLLFKGELVSQTKLPSGFYEITMKASKSFQTTKFLSKTPLDEVQIKKYEPGYEITVEYEIVKNKKTNKDEYYLKEFGTVSSVGAVKVTTQ